MTENNIIYLENIGHFRKWAISAVHILRILRNL